MHLRLTDHEGYALYDDFTMAAPSRWRASTLGHEKPILYHAVLTLQDTSGAVQEVVP